MLELRSTVHAIRRILDAGIFDAKTMKQMYKSAAEMDANNENLSSALADAVTKGTWQAAQIERLEAEKSELIEALRWLRDEQNDAPLERHRELWEACISNVDDVLAKYESKPEQP